MPCLHLSRSALISRDVAGLKNYASPDLARYCGRRLARPLVAATRPRGENPCLWIVDTGSISDVMCSPCTPASSGTSRTRRERDKLSLSVKRTLKCKSSLKLSIARYSTSLMIKVFKKLIVRRHDGFKQLCQCIVVIVVPR